MTDDQDIRVWARSKGLTIGDRGRIPKSVTEQYKASQADEEPEVDGSDDFLMPPPAAEPAADAPPADLPVDGKVVPERRP